MGKTLTTTSRIAYIDNLRSLMIILVVYIHTAVTYSGLGSWYYVENMSADKFSMVFFAFFQSFTQAYFMAFLFFFAGYFVPAAVMKKGAWGFLKERLLRLGVPLLLFIFLLHPLCVKMAYPGINLAGYYRDGIRSLDILSWSGPLWFALTLLIFSVLFVVIKSLLPIKKAVHFNIGIVMALIILITLLTFGIRLVYPMGTSVMNLQLCFFGAYIIMFLSGVLAYRSHIPENLNFKKGRLWLWISLGVGIPVWLFVLIAGDAINDFSIVSGGMRWQAFGYAFWESFFCVTFCIALIGIFKNRFNTQNALQKYIADNAFTVYVFHAPILIGVTICCKTVMIAPVLKFILCGTLAVILSFTLAVFIRKIPLMKRIFH